MDPSNELHGISRPAYGLQKIGQVMCTAAFVVMILMALLGILGLLNEWAGLSSRPRGYEAFVKLMGMAPFVGGAIASGGLFLIYCSEWVMHQRGFRYDLVTRAYTPAESAKFPYLNRVAMLGSCLFLHVPYLLYRWWRALPA